MKMFNTISIFLLIISLFFTHLIPVKNFYYTTLVALLVIVIIHRLNNLKIEKKLLLQALFVFLFLLIMSVKSPTVVEGLKYAYIVLVLFLIAIFFPKNRTSIHNLTKYLLITSLFFSLFTILQYLDKNSFSTLTRSLLSFEDYFVNTQLLRVNSYSGITGQTGVNAYFITIGIIILLSRLLQNDKAKLANILLLIPTFFSLILTQKRSHFLVLIVILLFMLIVKSKNKVKNLSITLVIVLITIPFFIYPQIGQQLIIRFQQASGSDFSNGRFILWSETMNIFSMSPIFGSGTGSVSFFLGELTHNIYLQSLAEWGMFGFMILVVILLVQFFFTLKVLKMYETKNAPEELLFFSGIQLYFILNGFFGSSLNNIPTLGLYLLSILIIKQYFNNKFTLKEFSLYENSNFNLS